jgi:ABC-type branched-subunit amino acid transport system substrate-binding protein
VTNDEHTQPDDLVERAQARLERMNEVAEELTRELDLPPEAKYDLLSIVYDNGTFAPDAGRDTLAAAVSSTINREATNEAAAVKSWLADISLPVGIAASIGILSFILGLLIVHVARISVLFAAPSAIFITALILALIMFMRRIENILWRRGAPYSFAMFGQGAGGPEQAVSGRQATTGHRRSGREIPSLSERPSANGGPKKRLKDRGGMLIATCCLLAASAASLGLTLVSPAQIQRIEQKTVTTTSVVPIPIGISYGAIAFDLNRPDGPLKQQAAGEMAKGEINKAMHDWRQAVEQDSSDAEALIYLEDQIVLAANRPYITLVVGTQFSKANVSDGRDDLQAAYVLQKQYNDQALAQGGPMLRLLVAVANADEHGSVVTVAREIVQAARRDSTIKGVMGWPTSASTQAALAVLSTAHIPLVSPTASADQLNTGDSPYFFRVSPTNQEQAIVGAQYAQQMLHATRIALFVDASDPYSLSLAKDFASSFAGQQQNGQATPTIIRESYTEGEPDTMLAALHDAINRHADLIYFSGYASDVGTILKNLPPCRGKSCLLVMGGDGLYLQGDYTLGSLTNYNRLRFTSFTFPVTGENATPAQQQFEAAFDHDFDPSNQYQPDTYGYNLPEAHTMLSYDTMHILVYAADSLMTYDDVNFSPEDLQAALGQIDAKHPFAGLSWPIAFGAFGNDINGGAVIIAGSADGKLSLVWQGPVA